MIPRTVRAPSNAPITKYRRTTGPRSVTSSSSRHHSRSGRRVISTARGEEGEDFALCGREGRVEGFHLRPGALRELGAPAPFPADDSRGGPEHGGGVPPPRGSAGHDDARGAFPLRPEDRDEVRDLRELLREGQEVRHGAADPVHDNLHPSDVLRARDEVEHRRPRGRGPRLLELPPLLLPFLQDPLDGGRGLVDGDAEGGSDLGEGRGLLPDRLERGQPRHVLEADDGILGPLPPEDRDYPDLARPRDVRAAAPLDVPLRDLDDPELPAR